MFQEPHSKVFLHGLIHNIIIPLTQMRKLRHREVRWLARDDNVSQRGSWDLNLERSGSSVHTNDHAASSPGHQSPSQ